MNYQTKWNIGQEPPCLAQQVTQRFHEVIFIFAANTTVISSIWTQKRSRSSSTRTTSGGDGGKMQKFCCHMSIICTWIWLKMNDHTYCMLHNKKGEASVSGKRRQVRDRRRHKRRINIGVALPKWRSVKVANGFQNNTDVAFFLLDRWVSLSSTGPINIGRKRWF